MVLTSGLAENFIEVYNNHKDKVTDKWSFYLDKYNKIFEDYKDKPVRVLEIGIQNGGSLEVYSKYFKSARCIIGCDINQKCSNLIFQDERIKFILGDANENKTKEQILNYCDQFDIIIDDGSHTSGDIIKSFTTYFPFLSEGGVYIAEDLHCSYSDLYQGGLLNKHSSIEFFKRLTDITNYEHWNRGYSKEYILKGYFKKYDCFINKEELSKIYSLEFCNSMCIVKKEESIKTLLGTRMLNGENELVTSGNKKLHKTAYNAKMIHGRLGLFSKKYYLGWLLKPLRAVISKFN